MSKKMLVDLNFDNTGRAINSPDPVNNGDLVPKNFILHFDSEATAETSTTSTTTYSTKATITTPALPSGNYIVEWSFKWRAANANRGIQAQITRNAAEILNHIQFSANVAETPIISGQKKLTGISGVQTIALGFRVGIGATTVFMSEALLSIRRVA